MTKPRDADEKALLQHEAEHTSPKKTHSVFIYLAVLAVVAFLLLLMAYLMQQRTNEAAMDTLQKTSSSAVESLENIIAERDRLRDQVDDLEDKLEAATAAHQSQLSDALAEVSRSDANAAYQARLLDALRRLDQLSALCAQDRYDEALAMLQDQEAADRWADDLAAISQAMTQEERDIYDPLEVFHALTDQLGVGAPEED